MAIRFDVNMERLRRATHGHGLELQQVLGISKNSLSRKLNGFQPISIDEINIIIEALNLDARDFVYFVDTKKKAEIKKAA
jgi:transcriptional regulator with XRE-family HTH domain